MDNRKKYNYMENVNFALNKRCITLNDEEIKRNNIILRSVCTYSDLKQFNFKLFVVN